MLKHGEINPLAVFGLRRVEHLPPHFVTVKFESNTNDKAVTDWIWEHLEGRFYIGDEYMESSDGETMFMQKVVGFEMPGESSMFALILDTINKREFW